MSCITASRNIVDRFITKAPWPLKHKRTRWMRGGANNRYRNSCTGLLYLAGNHCWWSSRSSAVDWPLCLFQHQRHQCDRVVLSRVPRPLPPLITPAFRSVPPRRTCSAGWAKLSTDALSSSLSFAELRMSRKLQNVFRDKSLVFPNIYNLTDNLYKISQDVKFFAFSYSTGM